MKHVLIIPDGGADKPLPELGGKTPFEAARTPNLDALAKMGRVHAVVTTPRGGGFEAGSDVCSMNLIGYDPARYHTGRAPIEAAAMGLRPGPRDWIFRMNFVTVGEAGTPDDGLMLDHSAGAITEPEARELGRGLLMYWTDKLGAEEAAKWSLTPGVAYRNILIDHSGVRGYGSIRTTPPHEMPRRAWRELLPTAHDQADKPGEQIVRTLMDLSREYLPWHPVNKARIAAGNKPANATWIWGHGTRPDMPGFYERFGLRGAMITAVDLLAGIAALIGWDRVDSPGLSSFHDNDYASQGRVTCGAIDKYDIVCSHVESPDEASHQGDWKTKLAAVEAIDREIVGPVVEHLRSRHGDGGWRVMVMPDHYTLVSTRKHDPTPVPCLIAGPDALRGDGARFTETSAAGAPVVDPGCNLMARFLGRG
ncbi:MAG: 2,3-bisphosphoglycerate-independent phosphoglycerate mutase [Phycisphaerales bacterium]|nr:2,3-bisphosphoglycerate-independent phosphoglycerate mutase [Phycisphaerales bacterium]